jgi:uncharacterized protein
MTNLTFHLFQLQKIDLRIDQIDARTKKIHDLVHHNQALQEASQKLTTSQAAVEQKIAEISDLDKAASAKSIKIQQSESALYQGKNQNPKELSDLQKEIASLKNALSSLEEQQLTKLADLDELNLTLVTDQKLVSTIADEWQTSNNSLLSESEFLNKEKDKLTTERQLALSQIPSESSLLYEKLRISKNHIAVTSVEDESCTICGSEISAADIQRAKNSSLLVTCPSCGRILYSG